MGGPTTGEPSIKFKIPPTVAEQLAVIERRGLFGRAEQLLARYGNIADLSPAIQGRLGSSLTELVQQALTVLGVPATLDRISGGNYYNCPKRFPCASLDRGEDMKSGFGINFVFNAQVQRER